MLIKFPPLEKCHCARGKLRESILAQLVCHVINLPQDTRTDIWVVDGDRINELRSDIHRLQDQLADRDLALDWAVQSRSIA
jgi:hypothetical protein